MFPAFQDGTALAGDAIHGVPGFLLVWVAVKELKLSWRDRVPVL